MFTNLSRSFARWSKARSIARELDALDDRELNDIGVSRRQIAEIANLSAAR